MSKYIICTSTAPRVARWYCDLMGVPSPGQGSNVAAREDVADLQAYAIPGWCTRYKMPATHPSGDGRVAFEVDDAVAQRWEDRKSSGDLDPALVSEFDAYVSSAGDLPADWYTQVEWGTELDQTRDVKPQAQPVLP